MNQQTNEQDQPTTVNIADIHISEHTVKQQANTLQQYKMAIQELQYKMTIQNLKITCITIFFLVISFALPITNIIFGHMYNNKVTCYTINQNTLNMVNNTTYAQINIVSPFITVPIWLLISGYSLFVFVILYVCVRKNSASIELLDAINKLFCIIWGFVGLIIFFSDCYTMNISSIYVVMWVNIICTVCFLLK